MVSGRRGKSEVPREKQIRVRASVEEHRILKEAAASCGLSLGAFAGDGLLSLVGVADNPLERNERLEEFAELSKARLELSKVGTNLNQVAFFFNSGHSVESRRLRELLRAVEAATDRIDLVAERLSSSGVGMRVRGLR